ncbi:DUF1471 domain-containing protein [Rosenbergiella australiborealis]|uniref:DUF1471 domain-containing protein n=1 Tax=Rosenbergiella australiborealis TaxID=1544696 RepID=A0ABS5T5A5_9GAMM|nr:DUF1471 domain-containing protein [Rosenbergiella australiborealis]MBT0727540.1 DUF1471 domain-containing protein [Rosenbergiella australiborealis]
MKKITIAMLALLALPAITSAKSVSVTDLSVQGAENKIMKIAEMHGAEYTITGASSGNFVRMTAILHNIEDISGLGRKN